MKAVPWQKLYYGAAEKYHWTPATVRDDLTIPDLVALKMLGAPTRAVPSGPAGPATIVDAINRKRAAKGLPPI